MDIYFLAAAKPLCKVFAQNGDGTIHKSAYPLVKNFTSIKESVNTTYEFFCAIRKHADEGECLLKGMLRRELQNESRQNSTMTEALTEWICLDFDRLSSKIDLEGLLKEMGLDNVSYIVQLSASQGLSGNEDTFSAHVFMRLERPIPAPTLKAWLMEQNFNVLKSELVLSRAKFTLHYPLDITACQNDKLIYIAPPIFKRPLIDPIKDRYDFVEKPLDAIPADVIQPSHIETLKKAEKDIINSLRKGEGLPTRSFSTKWVNGVEILNKPDECTVTGIKECGDYIRLNLNGGDSWAYWHPVNRFDLIYDFKTGQAYQTKELVPDYFKHQLEIRRAENATPANEGNLILAFRELKTGLYYNGIYKAADDEVAIYPAKNEKQLNDWLMSHGQMMDEFVPIWDIVYDTQKNYEGDYWHIDPPSHRINLFTPSEYMFAEPNANMEWKPIYDIIKHALGGSNECVAHFLNWFAAVFQRKARPLTAWVMHGIEGTGKGFMFNKILKPLLGSKNVISITTRDLRDNFNSFLENKLLVFVDEVDVDDFGEKGLVSAKLRNAITEPYVTIRPMRQVVKEMPNTLSFIFASNRPQPVYIPPTDRRYNVGEFQNSKLPPPNTHIIEKCLDSFAQYLAAWNVDKQMLNNIIHTKARAEIQQASMNSIEKVAQDLLQGNFEAFWFEKPQDDMQTALPDLSGVRSAYKKLVYRMAEDYFENGKKSVLTREELYVIFEYFVGKLNNSPAKFGRLLALNNLKPYPLKRNGQLVRGVTIMWHISSKEIETDIAKELKESGYKTGNVWSVV